MKYRKFPCPCCGYRVFTRQPGGHEVCPVCSWEDDLAQLRFPRMPGGANRVSLEVGQRNFEAFHAAARINIHAVRAAFEDEPRDADWRPLNPQTDNIEEPQRGIDYSTTYPLDDTTVLYYWRPNYWRRLSS